MNIEARIALSAKDDVHEIIVQKQHMYMDNLIVHAPFNSLQWEWMKYNDFVNAII